ncbi:GTP-binding protein [Paenibacillus sp. CFBP13512]|uniref:CobW family GTP-binding protein n=1 Tax=Paenibacillus TaxID=44249 RepID=UPI0010C0BC58|nr:MULTISPECIES: GTP-binding protein [Paenibacillus]TKJ91627.1 GTP-binding protein [Paenibacillus sp. CFBP13512]CAJ1315488.1 GTP-binding protein [Paenibacillus nuruki]
MTTPVYILSGFLGSGKTTMLQHMIQEWKSLGKTPAVIMNEIGDVNLDGMMVDQDVAMAELLSGCICCSIRADLSMELYNLMETEKPDVIIIEASGVANPIEILDAVTETSLYNRMELKNLITVVDAAHLWELYQEQKGKTYRLMQEQIRCASVLILNKSDRVDAITITKLEAILRGWNAYAPIHTTVRCEVPSTIYTDLSSVVDAKETLAQNKQTSTSTEHSHDHTHSEHMHGSHSHVMAYTHYFEHPINSEAFENVIRSLPTEVYRAKGILTFNDTASRFLFQYAYREMDFMKITPQKAVPDVAVFIGEHFDKELIKEQLLVLEQQAAKLL